MLHLNRLDPDVRRLIHWFKYAEVILLSPWKKEYSFGNPQIFYFLLASFCILIIALTEKVHFKV